MASIDYRSVSPRFPFASPLRSSDREWNLVQLMTSVWETILQLPIPGTGTVAMTGPRSFAAKCAAIMHEREPEALTEVEVRDGWGKLVNRERGGGLLRPRN